MRDVLQVRLPWSDLAFALQLALIGEALVAVMTIGMLHCAGLPLVPMAFASPR